MKDNKASLELKGELLATENKRLAIDRKWSISIFKIIEAISARAGLYRRL